MAQVHQEARELCAAVEEGWRSFLRSTRATRQAQPRDYVYASGRRSCVRWMALDLMHPEDQQEFGDDTLERFERGNEREANTVARLIHVGRRVDPRFDIVEGQRRFEIRDRDGVLLIVGKIDGKLAFEGAQFRPIFEVKSGESVERIERLEDFERSPWTRHMPDQLLSYLLDEGEPWGFFVLDRPGVPTMLPVVLEDHLERAEAFLRAARRAVDARQGEPLPEMTQDRSECRRCPHFGRSCAPPMDFGEGVEVIHDEHLIQLAEQREQNKAAARLFQEADKELKKSLRGCDRVLLDRFLATGQWAPLTTYDIPKEVKSQYRVTKSHGRFSLNIEAVEECDPIRVSAETAGQASESAAGR